MVLSRFTGSLAIILCLVVCVVVPTAMVRGDGFSDGLGDFNDDGYVDLTDMASLADCLLGPAGGESPECAPGDADSDGDVDMYDVAAVLNVFGASPADCNLNGVPDEQDIYEGTSDDCNTNTIPDECEIADGSCFDCNWNGILDVCDVAPGGPIHPDLVHRYSFSTGPEDSIGVAHGVMHGGALIESGAVVFDGVDDYVELPIGATIGTLTDATIEAWVDWSHSGGTWQRIFDIGTDTSAYMFLTPNVAGHPRFAIRSPTQNEQIIETLDAFPTGLTHVAVVIDDAAGQGYLYIDGQPVAENPTVTLSPSDLGESAIGYLGKSFWPDPFFNGRISEFRIYAGALESAEVSASFTAGPDAVAPPASPDCNGNDVPDECDIVPGDLPDSIRHRWSFTTSAADRIGDADGTLHNGASLTDQGVYLDGEDDFVALPIGSTMETTTSFTLEAWLTLHGGVNDPRLFECGRDSANYLFLTPKRGGWPVPPRYRITRNGISQDSVVATDSLLQSSPAHLAVTYDATTQLGQMYIDGLPNGPSVSVLASPANLGTGIQAFLGKSILDANFLYATVAEFRVYDEALTAQDLADNYSVGPDAENPGGSSDNNENGIPDECEAQDCNDNGVADSEDIAAGTSFDCNGNAVPDECDLDEGTSDDCNFDNVPDECWFGPPEGYGLLFDGQTAYVNLGTPSSLTELAVGDFTIETWIRTVDTSRSILIGNYNENPAWSFELHSNEPGSGHLRVYLAGEDHHDDVTVADGVWHHVAVVRKLPPDGYVRMFVDGEEAYASESTIGGYSIGHDTMLARDPRPQTYYYNGAMDEVRVWNLVRTEDQIAAEMFNPLTGTETGLVGYWRLDTGSGSVAFDSAGTADGVLEQGPPWLVVSPDCNNNLVLDECDIAEGTSLDFDHDGVPDECQY